MEKEYKLKGRFFIYIYYFVIPAFVIFSYVNYHSPFVNVEQLDLRTMLSVATFLFGFFISISFSMILSRASSLRDSLAKETGKIVSLFKFSKFFGETFNKKITERIDGYTVATLRNYNHYEVGREFIYEIYEDLKNLIITNEMQKTYLSSFLSTLNDLESTHEKIEGLTSEKLLLAMKLANYFLAGLLISLLFLNRGNIFTDVLFVVVSTVVIFILLIIEDYESLSIGDYTANISNSEQIFDLIEKERYYPYSIIGRIRLEKGRIYRIGVYDTKLKEEKIFNLAYNSKFQFNLGRAIKGFYEKFSRNKSK
jgi:ABC-type multidrug transport system fused ATPase/permease subunit